ncbi:MAG: AAA family ATPase [Clostridiales bacterium]|nr:AAA family ATPase [Clostridiales bacterium]
MAEKKSVFAPERAWRRLYYVYGFTDDEFYTDGCSKLDIVSFIHLELKRIGYERVILYDWHTQLYCLDEESYALVDATHRNRTAAQPVRIQNRGLRRGKWGAKSGAAPQPTADAPAATAQGGSQSGVEMVNLGDGQLHLGVLNTGSVARQINSYMRNADIKSAIVINLGTNFSKNFEAELGNDFAAGYGQLGADNKNIIVLIFTDNGVGNLFENDHEHSWLNESIKNKRVNDLHIVGPNASELRNMLSYFRLRHGLQYDLGQLDQLADALHHAMTYCEGTMRIKELYVRLEEFCKEKEPLTCDSCYSLLGISKPLSGQQQLDRLIGMQSVKEALGNHQSREDDRRQVFQYQTASRLQLDPPRPPERGASEMINFVITGRPGTGKTTVARIIGQLFYEMGYLESGHLVKVTRADLVAGYVGQTAIRTREKIQEAIGGVLFVDEAYSLKREDQSNADFGQEAIDTLNEAMTDDALKGKLIMVFAGYEAEMETFINANPGLCSRVIKLHIEDYTPEEMQQILQIQVAKLGYRFSEDFTAKLPDFCENWVNSAGENWGNGREAETLSYDLHHNWENDRTAQAVTGESGEEIRILETRHLPQKKRAYLKQEAPKTAIEQVRELIGFRKVKQTLADLLKLGQTARETGMYDLLDSLSFHWVLKGNPGTGKTTVAKLMGQVYKEMGLLPRGHVIVAKRQDLTGRYLGETEHKTQEVINRAMGGVLFIDEAYTLTPTSGDTNDYGQIAINTILEQMSARDGQFAVIVAGYPAPMERFLRSNPGLSSRFEQEFLLEDYTGGELRQIFEQMCEKQGFGIRDDLEAALEPLFTAMIQAKIKDWGNGREAEKLLRKMKTRWVHDTDIETNLNGEKVRYFALRHLPEEYSRYLEVSRKEQQPDAGSSLHRHEANGYVPSTRLLASSESFCFEQDNNAQKDSVVFIKVEDQNSFRSGTGSIITRDGYILTCNHVIRGAEKIQVRLKQTTFMIWQDATVIWNDEKMDAAILKLPDGTYPALALRPADRRAKPGEDIYHWGYAFGKKMSDNLDELEPSQFQGYVSSVQTKEGMERINVDMAAKRGCSGGPVFSKTDGTILGILCGSQIFKDDRLLEEINYVLPIRYIWENAIRAEDTPSAAPCA